MPAGRDEVNKQELHESAAQHGVTGRSHEAMRLPRQLRCHGAFVPLDRKFLRPRFDGFAFFVTPGDGSTTLHGVHVACQRSNILILLKVTA